FIPIALSYSNSHSPSTSTTTPASTTQEEADGLEAEDLAEITLCEELKKLTTVDAEDARFFGQASSVMLAKHVADVRNEIIGDSVAVRDPVKYRRAMYWKLSPWELPYVDDPETHYIYPEVDLLTSLVSLYFKKLASMFLVGTSMPYACWNLTAIGLRYGYEKGVHRRHGQSHVPTVENELLKRAFWALVCVDSFASSFVGRPCSMHETYVLVRPSETIFVIKPLYGRHDVEYPIECNDEYWETGDPTTTFQQPEGKPCSITAFNYFIKLCEILGFALRTLYANKKSKILLGFIGADWEERMVAELDSSMNKWREDLPKYLQWDPERNDSTFFHQSVNLHLSYYYVQIQIHRPYLTKKSSLTPLSLAMCNNSARACSHILEASLARGTRVLPNAVSIAYIAGMVITLNLLGNRSVGQSYNPREDMENLQKCVDYLEAIEDRLAFDS
ncbi:hypothetical protein CVT25_006754, partial [Psilocybe cyanescens]